MSHMCCLSVGLLLVACGSFLHIFGTAFPQWESGNGFERGLFEICFDVNDTCSDIDNLSTENRVAQAFALSGVATSLLGVFVATVFALLSLFGKAPRRLFSVLSSLVCLLAFLLSGACVVYWSREIHDEDDSDLDASFYMSSVGAFLMGVGGLMTLSSGKFLQGRKV